MTASFPQMIRVRQGCSVPAVEDVVATTRLELQRLQLDHEALHGKRIAVTAGSRGIANIATILQTIVAYFREMGAAPFIVPAMGSHGNATAEGQVKVLAKLGVTEATMNCPISPSMETVIIAHTANGLPVHVAREAFEADAIFLCNRIKSHTGFVGPVESGLHKMLLVGLGKHAGALQYHQAIASSSWEEIIRSVTAKVLATCRVLGGIAIVENARDETAHIESVRPSEFWNRETELLKLAQSWMPRLPFPACELLIVDRIGKNISGTGMDTNIIGRKFDDHRATDRDSARCKRIFVRGLTPETEGQAAGIGIAEFTNRRTANAINFAATAVNCITSSHPTAGMLPLVYETDHEAIGEALKTIGMIAPKQARIIQIRNTLQLDECLVSEAYREELSTRTDLEVIGKASEMAFDAEGQLADLS